MAEVQKRTYMYSVSEEGNAKYVDVEMAGRYQLNEGEDPKQKAKDLIVSTQRVDEETVELKKVDDISTGVVTSKQTKNK